MCGVDLLDFAFCYFVAEFGKVVNQRSPKLHDQTSNGLCPCPSAWVCAGAQDGWRADQLSLKTGLRFSCIDSQHRLAPCPAALYLNCIIRTCVRCSIPLGASFSEAMGSCLWLIATAYLPSLTPIIVRYRDRHRFPRREEQRPIVHTQGTPLGIPDLSPRL